MKQIIKRSATCCIGLLWAWCLSAQPNITRVEYYIDIDPGYGNATSISITPGTNLSNLTVNINPSTVSYGAHQLYIRARDANGAWSHDNVWVFARPYPTDTTTAGPVPKLVRVEYYIDADPGYGNATPVSFTPGTNLSDLTVNINPSTLTNGVHLFCIRALDSAGHWSHDNTWLFAKPYPTDSTVAGPKPNLKQVEYYIDTDPGYGNGVPVAINAVTNLPDFKLPINIMGLTAATHKLYIRSRDANGAWSLDNKYIFTVSTAITGSSIVTNSVTKKTLCAKDTLKVSYHVKGTYNSGNVFNVELSDATGSFASPLIIGSYTGTGNTIITCVIPMHITSGTLYRVRVSSTNPVVTGITGSDSLIIHDAPVAQTITGASNANVSLTYSYSVPFVAGDSWTWIVPAATVTPTADSAMLLWNTAGQPQTIKVVETNSYGCAADTSIKYVNVYPLRIDTVRISTTTPCPGGSFVVTAKAFGVYNAGNVFTAQLSDSLGSFANAVNIGTDTLSPVGNAQPVSINATMPLPLPNGTAYLIRVVSNSPAATGLDSFQNITIANLGASGIIRGQKDNLCGGVNNIKYTADSVANATAYNWSVPAGCTIVSGQGTVQIKVNFPANYNLGYITVKASNSCGTTGTDSLKVIAKPGIPKISGPKKVNANQAGIVYSTVAVPGLTYTWTVPAGAVITGGQGTSSIMVTWGTAAGPVSLYATNSCGSSGIKTLDVKLNGSFDATVLNKTEADTDDNKPSVYPNPAKNECTVVFNEENEARYTIEITDAVGRTALQKTGDAFAGENKVLLNISKLANGIYFITILDETHGRRVLKLNKE